MDKNSKFLKFVAKIEQKMLDCNQESMIVHAIVGEEIGGANGVCENGNSSCNGSINQRECTNQNSSGCTGTINRKTCTKSLSPL